MNLTKGKRFLSAECEPILANQAHVVAAILGISRSELFRRAVEYYIVHVATIETLPTDQVNALQILSAGHNGNGKS